MNANFLCATFHMQRVRDISLILHTGDHNVSCDMRHEKTDLKVFVVVIPEEGWARVAVPILLLA